jgi:hypothetical protein
MTGNTVMKLNKLTKKQVMDVNKINRPLRVGLQPGGSGFRKRTDGIYLI